MKILFLVESPGKITKIKSILNNLKDEYIVMASVGHIRNLDSKNMSIDIDNNPSIKINDTKSNIRSIIIDDNAIDTFIGAISWIE